MPERVALMGLGLMGNGMAQNLLRGGFPLTVYNRTRDKVRAAETAGARVAESPLQAAQQADVIISMVSDDAASRAVWLGRDGALEGARSGALLIESSTLTPKWVRELGQIASTRQITLLDAPVTGSKPQAEAGELTFFVGGDPAALERARPVLKAMGHTIYHLGPTGSGATMKLVNNSLSAVEIAALGEVFALAEHGGLDVKQVADILSNGVPGSPVIRWRSPMILSHQYETRFALRLMHKDLSYALDEAAQLSVPLPTVAVAREIYRLAMVRGLGELDFSAVTEALKDDPQVAG